MKKYYSHLFNVLVNNVFCSLKVPKITDLEKRSLNIMSKHANNLIERRRQDIRDQAKEIADATSIILIKSRPSQFVNFILFL